MISVGWIIIGLHALGARYLHSEIFSVENRDENYDALFYRFIMRNTTKYEIIKSLTFHKWSSRYYLCSNSFR